MKKRILALLLTATMLFSLLPTSALAEEKQTSEESALEQTEMTEEAAIPEEEPADESESTEDESEPVEDELEPPEEPADESEEEPAEEPAEEPVEEDNEPALPVEEDDITASDSSEEELALAAGSESDEGDEIPVLSLDETVTVVFEDTELYYAFTPEESGVYTFESSNNDCDTYATLYNSGMSRITSDDDGGNGNNFLITYALNAGETYILGVRTLGGGAGTFNVLVTKAPTSGTISDGNISWSFDNGTLTFSGEGDMQYNGSAPWRGFEFTAVAIGSGITSIGYEAFYNCSSLTSVSIPESVTSIGSYAFYNCSSLTSVSIPESVTSIGNYAFYNCSSLTEVALPAGVKLGADVFTNTPWLESQRDEDGFAIANGTLFSYNGAAEELRIPEGVTTVGGGAFKYKYSLKSVVIPASVSYIGEDAFYYCEKLEEVIFEGSNTTAASSAFSGTPARNNSANAGTITLDEPVSDFYYGATRSYSFTPEESGMYTVKLSASVNGQIDIYNENGGNLSSRSGKNPSCTVSFTAGECYTIRVYLNECTFYTLSVEIKEIPVLSLDETVEVECGNSSNPTYFNFIADEEGLYIFTAERVDTQTSDNIRIGFYNEGYNSSWSKVTIRRNMTAGETCTIYVFRDNGTAQVSVTKAPTSGTISGGRISWSFDNGTLTLSGEGEMWFNDDSPWKGFEYTAVEIGSGITSICSSAFSGCSSLTSVSIPESVTSIGDHAFYYCSSLTSVSIPEGVTSIGSYAFAYCSSLTSVSIPEGVTSIGSHAFAYCSSLTSVSIPESVTSIGYAAFYNCSSLTEVALPEGVKLGSNVFAGTPWLENLPSDEDGFVVHNGTLFSYNGTAEELRIPDSVTTVGGYVFAYNNSLKSVVIPAGMSYIGEYAFYNCSNLEEVIFEGSNTAAERDAFYGTPARNNSANAGTITLDEPVSDFYYGTNRSYSFTPEESGMYTVKLSASVNGQIDIYNENGDGFSSGWTNNPSLTVSLTAGECYTIRVYLNECTFYTLSVGAAEIPVLNLDETQELECGNWNNRSYFSFTADEETLYIFTAEREDVQKDDYVVIEFLDGGYGSGDKKTASVRKPLAAGETCVFCVYRGNGGTVQVNVTKAPTSGTISDGKISWSLDNGTLTLSGEGDMWIDSNYPWEGFEYTALEIGSGITSIASSAFYRSGLTSVTIPDSVTDIYSYPFAYCESLTSVSIPEGVTSIGDHAFYCCSSLTEVTLPAAADIDHTAFLGTPWLNENYTDENGFVVFQNVLTSYSGDGSDIVLPDGVTAISDGAFANNSNISSVVIPASVESIGKYAFYGCNNLTSVDIQGENVKIERSAFVGTPWLDSQWDENGFQVLQGVLIGYSGDGGDIVIPDGVTAIDDYAFIYFSRITSVVIPASVTSIGERAFYRCLNLTSVDIQGENVKLDAYVFTGTPWLESQRDEDGFIIICNKLISYNGSEVELAIPERVTDIGEYAFHFSNVQHVTIPSGVTSLAYRSFADCTSLQSVDIPDAVTSIDSGAFVGCRSLQSVEIPAAVTYIGNDAFGNCDSLQRISFTGDAPSFDDRAFENTTTIAVYPHNNATWTERVRRSYGGNITWVADDELDGLLLASGSCGENLTWTLDSAGLLTISGEGAMEDHWHGDAEWSAYNKFIVSVVIESGVTGIGYGSFYGCGLTSISIPNTVAYIGDFAFCGCSILNSINIPNGVTSIGECAFQNCSSLTSIAIPGSVTAIYDYAFAGSGLTSISIPGSVTCIYPYAFADCADLGELSFRGNAPTICYNAFLNVSATAYYPANDDTWTEDMLQSYGGDINWVAYDSVKPGDANGDGDISVKDVVLIMRHIAGDTVELNTDAADVNKDGTVSVKDVVLIMRFIAGDNVTLG